MYIEGLTLIITNTKLFPNMSEAMVREFYKEHEGKSFFDELIRFMSSGPIIALIVTGDLCVSRVRGINGPTNPATAQIGTIRATYGSSGPANAVHGSATIKDAEREIAFIFPHKSLINEFSM